MQNVVIYLIGYPGTGKYTIGRKIAERADFILVDNHLINNPIFSLVKSDGITPLPQAVWDNVHKVRDAVMHTIEHVADKAHNYILTNYIADDDEDRALYEKIEQVFVRRGSTFLPVILTCDLEEHQKRIVTDMRRERLKEINPEAPARYREDGILNISHPNTMHLDVTNIPPEDAADLILGQVSSLIGMTS